MEEGHNSINAGPVVCLYLLELILCVVIIIFINLLLIEGWESLYTPSKWKATGIVATQKTLVPFPRHLLGHPMSAFTLVSSNIAQCSGISMIISKVRLALFSKCFDIVIEFISTEGCKYYNFDLSAEKEDLERLCICVWAL